MLLALCPLCSEVMDPEETAWLWQGLFYCSEQCCRKAANNG